MLRKLAVIAVFTLAAMGAAAEPPAAKPAPYLSPGDLDTYAILPPAPVAGTTRYEADRTVFLQTRKLEGTPRWALAQADNSSIGLVRAMACAVGVELTPQNAPLTYRLLSRVARDSGVVTNRPKDIYKRQRPYLIDEGPTCIAKTPALAASPDYPSGHNTWGWSVGLILAELSPERATQIMARARAFGESRLVCGVHSMSAVHMGWANGSILVAALHRKPEFRRDLEAARKEVEALRKAGPAPDSAACAAEAEVIAQKLY